MLTKSTPSWPDTHNIGMATKATVAAGAITILAGLAGAVAHGLLFASTPVWFNEYIPVWFACSLAFVGMQLVYIATKPRANIDKLWTFAADVFYYVVLLLATFIGLVAYGVGGNWPAFAWCLVLFFAIAVSIGVLFKRRFSKESTAIAPSDAKPRIKRCCACCGATVVSFFKGMHLFFACFLAAGAVAAAYANSFAARGKMYEIDTGDSTGRTMRIHVYCIGETNTAYPTLWLVADSAHGVVDFYGLQFYLNRESGQQNRRVCSYDNIGFGWSDHYKKDTLLTQNWFGNLVAASGEQTPLILIGWGAGGSTIAAYTKARPSDVAGLGFITVYPPGIEFTSYVAYKSLSVTEAADYRRLQLFGRNVLSQIILALAIPWGLMSIIVPSAQDPTYYPPDRWMEFRVQLWTSKAWMTQYAGIKYLQSANDTLDPLFAAAPLPPIRLAHVVCKLTDDQACLNANGGAVFTGDACTLQKFNNRFYQQQQLAMTLALVPNATLVNNTETGCGLALPLTKPEYTAQKLWAELGSVGRYG
ncbi:hypothetical protein BC831DRAFT_456835 [Entophlyctis helioformis]|nr:hypothetical protein BC831DRAFT_456835 [Entophlyctis helioformis]